MTTRTQGSWVEANGIVSALPERDAGFYPPSRIAAHLDESIALIHRAASRRGGGDTAGLERLAVALFYDRLTIDFFDTLLADWNARDAVGSVLEAHGYTHKELLDLAHSKEAEAAVS